MEVVPDDDQPRKTGDQIPSNLGAAGEKHYVSPKKSAEIPDDFVVLKAKGIDQELFEKVLEWEGGEAVPNEPLKRRVKRDATGKTVVKLKTKDGGQEVDLMNVWVVWASMQTKLTLAPTVTYFAAQTRFQTIWDFTATIKPQSIFDKNKDIPDMIEKNESQVPNANAAHAFDGFPFGDADFKWDISRRWRERDLVPTLTGNNMGWPAGGALNPTLPNANVIQKTSPTPGADHYPKNRAEGNDDGGQDKDPYNANGILTDNDPPSNVITNNSGNVGDTAETRSHFVEFVRVEINKKWYVISDFDQGAWRWHMKIKKKDEAVDDIDYNGDGDKVDKVWVEDGSLSDATNNGF